VLLDENKKLNEQLLRIDENNRKVTEEVETELQTQIDQQVEQLSQLIALVKEAEQRRIDKESESILSSPLALVIIMSVVTLLIILVLAIYLLKKPAPIAAPSVIPPSEDIIDDELVIGQVSDELDQDSEDLMVALSNEDALEEDDILSDALEDDDAINAMSDAEMDADLDGLDDMLVPDLPTEVSNIGVSIDSNNAESKSDDGISLEIEDDLLLDEDFASLDLSEPDELGNDNDGIDSETIIDSSSLSESSELEEEQDNSDGSPLGVNLDENGEIDENTIEQIGQKIKAKDETISRMADEILKELDKVPSDSTNIHELVDEENIENEFDADDLSNELLLDLADDEDSSEELDALLESIGDDVESSSSELDESLSVELDEELDKPLDLSAKEDDALSEDLENDQVSQLTDELLKELDNDEPDEVHDLLDELKDTTINANDSNLGNDTSLSKQSEQSLMQKDEIMSPSLDADDLLDDIPSFTSDMSVDDDDLEDLIDEIPETVATDAEIIQEIEESKEIEIPAVDEVDVKSTAQAKDEELEADKIDLDDEDPLDLLDESDEDVLAGLKDLDNWLDEDDQTEPTKEAKDDELDLSALALDDEFDSLGEGGSSLDDGLIQGLDDANFDDMLKDLALDSDINNDLNSKSQSMDDPLASAGLDLDSLMNDDSSLAAFDNEGELVQAKNTESQANDTSEDFVDVDDLLEESDAMAQMIDSDKELDLNGSLDKLTAKQQDEVAMPAVDVESDQASNLDLAQVYMDMEDFEAAKELLDEVVRLGNQEQQEEATGLLVNIKP
jgi:pilus assembly protein FimV